MESADCCEQSLKKDTDTRQTPGCKDDYTSAGLIAWVWCSWVNYQEIIKKAIVPKITFRRIFLRLCHQQALDTQCASWAT